MNHIGNCSCNTLYGLHRKAFNNPNRNVKNLLKYCKIIRFTCNKYMNSFRYESVSVACRATDKHFLAKTTLMQCSVNTQNMNI